MNGFYSNVALLLKHFVLYPRGRKKRYNLLVLCINYRECTGFLMKITNSITEKLKKYFIGNKVNYIELHEIFTS